jgi:hypothetical protein
VVWDTYRSRRFYRYYLRAVLGPFLAEVDALLDKIMNYPELLT